MQTVLAAIWWIFKKPPQNEHFYGDKGSRLNIYSRGVLYFLLCYGWYRGLELVPIGDAEAVIFITPLMIVMVARFYLKEELSAVFPATFLMTVAGIIFVCQPDFIFHGANGAESMNVAGFIFLFLMVRVTTITYCHTPFLPRSLSKHLSLNIKEYKPTDRYPFFSDVSLCDIS